MNNWEPTKPQAVIISHFIYLIIMLHKFPTIKPPNQDTKRDNKLTFSHIVIYVVILILYKTPLTFFFKFSIIEKVKLSCSSTRMNNA